MTKRDLAIRIAKQAGLQQNEVMKVIQLSLDTIVSELAANRSVEFRNFGVFEVVTRQPRVGRNPNAPKNTVEIPARTVVKFKPGKVMEAKVGKLVLKKGKKK